MANTDEIMHHEPCALQVGDRVARPPYTVSGGEIKAICDGIAWVKIDAGGFRSFTTDILVRE